MVVCFRRGSGSFSTPFALQLEDVRARPAYEAQCVKYEPSEPKYQPDELKYHRSAVKCEYQPDELKHARPAVKREPQEPQLPATHVVFCIDNSGSMRKRDVDGSASSRSACRASPDHGGFSNTGSGCLSGGGLSRKQPG